MILRSIDACVEFAQSTLPTGSNVQIADGALLELNGTDQQIGSLSGASGSYVDLGGATLTVSGSGNTTFAGTIYGTGGFVYSGGSTLTLSGTNSYTGTTTVSAGTLRAGSAGAFSSNSDYVVTGTLDLKGYSPTIGSLSGSGTVTDSAASTTSVLTVGDGISTAFSGVIQNGSGTVGLDVVVGSGTFTLSGASTYTGPTQINTGTLEVNTNVIPSAVTIGPSGTLDGNGGTGQVTNLGGTYSAEFYQVTIVASSLQRGDAASPNSGSDALVSGGNGKVLALSAAGAAFLALTGSATSSSVTYALNSMNFTYESDLVVTDYSGDTHNVGPALVFNEGGGEDTDEGYGGGFTGFQPDYLPLTDALNTTAPIAQQGFYQDGVGGVLTKDAAAGLLANDTSQSMGTLSVASVNGSTSGSISTTGGTLTWSSNGSFTYTPNAGFYGTDSFTYIATDGTNQSSPTTVTIQVLLPQISLSYNGNPVLLSDDSTDPTGNADTNHLAQVSIAIDPDSVFASLPYNLTDWKLNLDAVGAGSSVDFWSSLGKTTELDNNGPGNQSWSLGSTLSSGAVPANIWVAVNNPGVFNLSLNWITTYGSTVPAAYTTQTVTVGGQAALLFGGTINTSAPNILTGFLFHGEQAYVPLSNESQVYNLEDNGGVLTQDRNYSGAIPNDQFLLPVRVTGAPSTAYLLTYSAGISLWQTGDRTGIVPSTITTDASGHFTFFVEGDLVGTSKIYLYQSGDSEPVDSLTVNVFSFTGPQDVPGYSTYGYGVTGLPAATSIPWSVNNQGTLPPNPKTNGSNAVVQWKAGGTNGFGQVSYRINGNYTWSYYVNVVNISVSNFGPAITATATAGAFQTEGSTITGPGGIESVAVNSDSDDESSEGASAAVTMVGPKGIMVGPLGNNIVNPNGNWGVDQMVVGYIQILNAGTEIIGNYGSYGSLVSLVDFSTPLLDTSNLAVAWQYHEKVIGLTNPQIIDNQKAQFWGTPVQIETFDKPASAVPAFFSGLSRAGEGFAVTGPEVTSATIADKFSLYVDAGIRVSGVLGAVLDNAYLSLSTASWSWTGSGTFVLDGFHVQYTAAAHDGVVGSAAWMPSDLEMHTLLPGYPRANQIGQEGVWQVQYNTD